jgi:serine/threonine protein kinase
MTGLCHIDTPLATFVQETEAFMIMDLCDGTLDSILQAASGTLPDRAILKIFGDVCSGVLHMHSQQPPIAHRWLLCDRQLT